MKSSLFVFAYFYFYFFIFKVEEICAANNARWIKKTA